MPKSDKSCQESGHEPKKVLVHIDFWQKNARELFAYILKYAHEQTHWIVRRTPVLYRNSMDFIDILSSLYDWKPDGIIMNYGQFPKQVQEMNIPILCGPNVRGIPENAYQILDNSKAVAQMVADYFINRNFKRFAYCGLNHNWSYDRCKHFSRIVQEAGFEISVFEPIQKETHYSWQEELDNLTEWLKSLEPPTALFACNDDRAEEIITICEMIDLKIPEDIAILGMDNDTLLCETTTPKLSSLAFNLKYSSFVAVDMLNKLMNGIPIETPSFYNIPTHIVTRQSTNIAAVDDKLVIKALEFIYQYRSKLVQVQDVASFVGISSRELRRRFKNSLNRSVQYEITRNRVELIQQMLLETELSVSDIAEQLGYPPESKYITRFFKKISGMTPYEYRSRYSQH